MSILPKALTTAVVAGAIMIGTAAAAFAVEPGLFPADPSDQITEMRAPNGSNGGGFVLHRADASAVTYRGVYLRNARGGRTPTILQASYCNASRTFCTNPHTVASTTLALSQFVDLGYRTGINPTSWVATRICDEGSCSGWQFEMRGGA